MSPLSTFVAASLTLPLLACNPVQSDAVSALGDDAPGVRNGPLHRPGQPCLLCHDGAFGSPQQFSVAGTVFQRPDGAKGVDGVIVDLEDSNGAKHTAITNAAGNFYVQPSEWQPRYPMTVSITPPSGPPIEMHTLIGWSGACASCHTSTEGPDSAGPVVIELDDGGVAP